MINTLKNIIAINSERSEALPNAPFGAGARQALDFFLQTAKDFGMTTGEYDGYCGWAEIGSGALVGILAHLDIVPCGQGWSTDPLTLTIENGNFYGRGITDDKGPAIACLYAMKGLLDSGKQLDFRVRLIVGCGEETGCECMQTYAKCCEIPAYSFTPDANFPAINSEKGIAHILIKFPYDSKLLAFFSHIRGGERANIVPSVASALLSSQSSKLMPNELSDLLRTENVATALSESGIPLTDFHFERGSKINIIANGVSAHGSTPELGSNAVTKLGVLCAGLCPCPSLNFIAEYLAVDCTKNLNIDICDKSGALTLNTGIIDMTDGVLSLTLDLRLPMSADLKSVLANINEKLPLGCETIILEHQDSLYIDEQSSLVTSLVDIYNKHFNCNEKPLAIGGGTYAKALPNCLAFGPCPKDADYRIHNTDEYMPVELMYKLVDIYTDAIFALGLLTKNK